MRMNKLWLVKTFRLKERTAENMRWHKIKMLIYVSYICMNVAAGVEPYSLHLKGLCSVCESLASISSFNRDLEIHLCSLRLQRDSSIENPAVSLDS